MIRIIHTADLHLGKKFRGRDYTPTTREALIEERWQALQRLISEGNQRQAHFLVIAGDLFDTLHLSRKDIQRCVAILKTFEGEAVLVLPGNHDFYDNGRDGLWDTFRQASDDRILVLATPQTLSFSIGEQEVIFYPAPCHRRHSAEPVIEWIKQAGKKSGALHVGIAHGHVEGLGIDGDRYFPMTPEQLRATGMDIWLLGHLHVPYPIRIPDQRPDFLIPATHTPEDFNCSHPGFCWYLEMGADQAFRLEQIQTGALRFHRLHLQVAYAEDLTQVEATLRQLPPDRSLVHLRLSGRLSAENRVALQQLLASFQATLLHLEIVNEVALLIDPAYLDQHYVPDTLPHRLLSNLAAGPDNDLTLQLAHQLIQQLSR